jgi:hypothetical protein
MDSATREAYISQYRAGAEVLAEAIERVGSDRLDVSVLEGEWTPRQIVHHVADSETMSYGRLRRLLAEDHPTIHGYDETNFARKLHYDRPIESSLAVVRAVRAASADLLLTLSEAEWQREGVHTESGRYTVIDWLRIYARHCHDHAEQMLRDAGVGGEQQ